MKKQQPYFDIPPDPYYGFFEKKEKQAADSHAPLDGRSTPPNPEPIGDFVLTPRPAGFFVPKEILKRALHLRVTTRNIRCSIHRH